MITSVKITDNKNAPMGYISKLKAFRNGAEYVFSDNVNIIVGANGSGKTTLLKLIKRYLSVYRDKCERGPFNSTVTDICKLRENSWEWDIIDGIDVFADYKRNTFSYLSFDERSSEDSLRTFKYFGELFQSKTQSKGQKSMLAIHCLFDTMFNNADAYFDYEKEYYDIPAYIDYINKHRVETNKWLVLLDEPDNSVDINNLKQLYEMFVNNRNDTQIIAVLHNPFLIAKLANVENIKFIELTKDYVKKVQTAVKKFNFK